MQDDDASVPASERMPRRDRNIAFAVVAGGMLLSAMDSTIVSTALPTIVGDLGGGSHMSWVVTAYLLTQTIATVLAGKFGDIFGRKRIFLISIVLFIAASIMCGLATGMTWLIITRAIQGIGGGGLTVTATAIVADIVPLRERGKYQGAIGSVFGMSTVFGPAIGGLLTDNLSWRWVFYVNVPIAMILFPIALKVLPSTKADKRPTIDYLGISFIAAASACLILATSWGGTRFAWGSTTIIGLFAAGIVLLGAFAVTESRAASPMLPLRLFRRNVFSISSILAFVVGFAFVGCMTFLPTFLQYCRGVSPTGSGFQLFPMVIAMLIASVGSGTIVSHTGVYKVFPVVGPLTTSVGLWILHGLEWNSPTWRFYIAVTVLGFGIGLSMQVLTIIVQNTVDYRDLGVATSGVTFFRTLGSAFGAAVFGTIYANKLAPALSAAVTASGADAQAATTPQGVRALGPAQHAAVAAAYGHALSDVFMYAIPVTLAAFVIALFLKTVPLNGLNKNGAKGVASGLPAPASRTSPQVLEAQVARLLHDKLPDDLATVLDCSGLDAVQLWVVRVVAGAERSTGRPAVVRELAHDRWLPTGVITPAIDDALLAGLIEASGDGVTLTDAGQTAFHRAVDDVWTWLRSQIESENGVPLSDDDAAQARAIASQIALDPRVSTAPTDGESEPGDSERPTPDAATR